MKEIKLRIKSVLYTTLFDIANADSEFSSPYLAKREGHRRLYIVIAGDRGLAGGYNANILKAVAADAGDSDYCVLPIGKKTVEHFAPGRTPADHGFCRGGQPFGERLL